MFENRAVNELTLEEAREELARLAYVLSRADIDYHQNNNPNPGTGLQGRVLESNF